MPDNHVFLTLLTVFLVGICMIPAVFSENVPNWIKNTAGWWATDAISETEFVNAIAYLIKNGIISIESSKSPEIIADMWLNGQINDDEFLTNVEQLIEAERIIIPDSSIIETSQLPDWLVNNAAWWAARIITNSDFHFDPDYVNKELYPCIEFSPDVTCFSTSYNSYGFRGNEFQEYKHDVDFRIFAVGGSTTFGPADDGKTWPDYLQQIMNENISGKKIEVINTGTAGATSDSEYGLIKNILSTLDPDLIIMYDGWNDHQEPVPLERTIQNWESVCKLGEKEGFDTMVVVQPLTISGNRVLTDQEITNTFLTPTSDTITNFGFNNNAVAGYVEKSQQYVNAFRELGDKCAITADFRKIFDYIQAPIFYDAGHTLSFGNEIIAQNMFSVNNNWKQRLKMGEYVLYETHIEIDYVINDDLSLLLMTSGSTDRPEFVRLSHLNIYSNTKAICHYLNIRDNDKAITTLPMSYSYGISIINTHLFMGATLILTDSSIVEKGFWQLITNYEGK